MEFEKLKNSWSFLAHNKVIVACSGGLDSVVLLHFIQSFCKDIVVVHVNYGLRGVDSDMDEQFVRELCVAIEVPLEVKKVDCKSILKVSGGNLQEVARKIRYDFFEEQIHKYPGSYVVLGQHADDQVETFFQHLARKSGNLGMACMLPIHKRYVRPFLDFSKEELRSYAMEHPIVWREDRSNSENKYSRNRIRNIMLPKLYEEIPSLKTSVLNLVKVFQETQRENEKEAYGVYDKILVDQQWDFKSFDYLPLDIRLEVVRLFGGDYALLAQMTKLRNSQKGKWIQCGIIKIYRENDGFYFDFGENERAYTLHIQGVEILPQTFSKTELYLDATKIEGDLVLRKWEKGDRIFPIGMKGSKLISDVLTEAKVPTAQRSNSLVLVDDKNVLWCVGYKVSSKSVATKQSEKIIKVQIVEK